jgi:asparagine synthetase A
LTFAADANQLTTQNVNVPGQSERRHLWWHQSFVSNYFDAAILGGTGFA